LANRSATPALNSPWLIAIIGFAAMYLPVYWWAATGIWQSDEQAHGALILLVMLWLFWGLRQPIATIVAAPAPRWGWPIFAFGLLVYFVGRVFNISILEFGSQPFVVAGILLLLKGKAAVRVAWFALFYFIFMIPLPGIIVDAVTGPLKQWISAIVVEVLYGVGYPISRNGVILDIGQYQMLVADACSGLHSMYSLSALGTLFMYIMGRTSRLHNAIMLASILPIAFMANIVRVMALVLITYHLGDEAGQGFLHGAAGIVLMLVALLCFFAFDAALDRVLGRRSVQPAGASADSPPLAPPPVSSASD
jgi:exosortase B